MSQSLFESQAAPASIRAAQIGRILFVLLLASCGGVKPAPPGESPQTASAQAGPAGAAQVAPAVTPPSPPLPPAVGTQGPVAAVAPAERPTAPSMPAPASQVAVKAGAPSAKAPAKVAPPGSAAQPPKKDIVAQAAPTQKAAPPLDLTSLETRLKETEAIGVMTKIALKNQVDDLLDQFRAFYAGKLKTTLAELRRPYDLLVLKVLSLLQDSDPSLAAAIVASREAIWGILSDPVKFAKFAST
jgi:hypothetical protein